MHLSVVTHLEKIEHTLMDRMCRPDIALKNYLSKESRKGLLSRVKTLSFLLRHRSCICSTRVDEGGLSLFDSSPMYTECSCALCKVGYSLPFPVLHHSMGCGRRAQDFLITML